MTEYSNYRKLLIEIDHECVSDFDGINHRYGNKYFGMDKSFTKIDVDSKCMMKSYYNNITCYLIHKNNKRGNLLGELSKNELKKCNDTIICCDFNINDREYDMIDEYLKSCDFIECDTEYVYNASEVDEDHKRRRNMRIFYKSKNFALQSIMNTNTILMSSAHVIIPFKIIDASEIMNDKGVRKIIDIIEEKISGRYDQKIKRIDTVKKNFSKQDTLYIPKDHTVEDDKHIYETKVNIINKLIHLTDFMRVVLEKYTYPLGTYSCFMSELSTIKIIANGHKTYILYGKAMNEALSTTFDKNLYGGFDIAVELETKAKITFEFVKTLILKKKYREYYNNIGAIKTHQILSINIASIYNEYNKLAEFIKSKSEKINNSIDEIVERDITNVAKKK